MTNSRKPPDAAQRLAAMAGAKDRQSTRTDGGSLSPAQLSELFRTEHSRLARFVRRRIGDADEAADLVQDAFARLLQARPSGVRAPQAYLQRIVGNLLRDRFKRAEHRWIDRTDWIGEEHHPIVQPQQTWGIEAEDTMVCYVAAVNTLSPRTREVFLLHRVEELRYRDIAERLDITVATVEYHMARALIHLDRALER